MNIRYVTFPALILLTLALAACDKRDTDNYPGGDSSAGTLPNGGNTTDTVGLGSGNIPPAARIDNPDANVDYSLLAADTVYFAFDSSKVPINEQPKLQAVQTWLSSNPGRKLYLAGHADKRGTAEYNRALGERRAEAVRAYLISLGADPNSLATNSYGADRPAVDGDSEAAYAKNRRVEVGVVKQ